MLNLLSLLSDQFQPFNLFRYLTFRTGGALMTALVFSFLFGPRVIAWLKSKQGEGQPIRLDGPEGHLLRKKGTPTMGGFLILTALIGSTLLWAELTDIFVWVVLFVTTGFGVVGFFDDYRKLTKRSSNGLSGRYKLLIEIGIAAIACIVIVAFTENQYGTIFAVPFLKNVMLDLGWFIVPVAVFVVVGASNAVNLTDGLDGLAIVPAMIAAASFGLIAYLTGNFVFANYLQIHHVPGAGELTVFCGALVGAGLGFLWFNAPPAMVFMGDTGSLPIGAALGTISVITKNEIVLAIIGGLFVLEAVSVIVQVGSFKLTGKRVFRMAPIHHHYEKKGWEEPTIVIRFWIIAVILAIIGLSTLKLKMISLPAYRDRAVAVLGLARSGLAAAEALAASGARVLAWDDDAGACHAAASKGVALADLGAAAPSGWAALVMSPGIPLTHPSPHPVAARALAAGIPVIGDIELLWQAATGARFLGITGTNGKSTTTALIGHVLAQAERPVAIGGNLGTPVLSLPQLGPDGTYVIEMSSYQLDLIRDTRFAVAILLNVTPDHLDRHGDMDGYVAAKQRIFRNQRAGDTAIIGVDDERCSALADALEGGPARVVRISAERAVPGGVYFLDGTLIDDSDGLARPVIDLRTVPSLPGAHNRQNAAAAYAAARASGLGTAEIAAGLAGFAGLAHRQELVAQLGKVRFVNDSKATNADAAAKALACYEAIHWIAGGVPKAGGIEPLRGLFPRIRHAYLIGTAATEFQATLGRAVPSSLSGDLPNAVRAAAAAAGADPAAAPVVLLSPACASFDQYRNFEIRGDAFRRIVHDLVAEAAP